MDTTHVLKNKSDHSQQGEKIVTIYKKFRSELAILKKKQDELVACYIKKITDHEIKILQDKIKLIKPE